MRLGFLAIGSKGAAIEEVTTITRMAEGRVKRVLDVGGVT